MGFGHEITIRHGTSTNVVLRNYTYDALGRVSARTQTRGSAAARSDAFGYNARSELTSATLGSDAYAYAFDNVGNRGAATEAGTQFAYTTNELNQCPTTVSYSGQNRRNVFSSQ